MSIKPRRPGRANAAPTLAPGTPLAGRLGARLVLIVALLGVLAVWVLGAFWSLEEQTRAAEAEEFTHPLILPFLLDGFGFTLAALALGASFDGRAAIFPRLGALVALAGSAYVNARGVYIRSDYEPTPDAVVFAVIPPVAAYVAFEVLLSSIRRQVQRWRGEPAPVPVPMPRPIRLLLSPWRTFVQWRREVLRLTASGVGTDPAAPRPGAATEHAAAAPPAPDPIAPVPVQPGTAIAAGVPVHPRPQISTPAPGHPASTAPIPVPGHPLTPAATNPGMDVPTGVLATAPTQSRPGRQAPAAKPVRADEDLLAILAAKSGPVSIRSAARELGCGVDRARRLLRVAGLLEAPEPEHQGHGNRAARVVGVGRPEPTSLQPPLSLDENPAPRPDGRRTLHVVNGEDETEADERSQR